ncbi:NAD binding domain of 6-phosphogluconate dehydrogenase-domain-containing protein [Hyaloscypha finlandica]|nr:NAD binding domain of 6-phosphogluconate dehydrogenase-domain-containing protein [Hyaloscypha finlandica]
MTQPPKMAPQLAFLGMGALGKPISKNLVLNGKLEKSLILWNRTSSRAYEHSTQIGNSVVAETIKDAISMSDIVWSCLADQDAVLETFELILKEDIKGKLFVECSTFTAEATNDLARKVIDSGGEFVAMPVFGEPGMANRAMLTCIPAGAAESVQKVVPYIVGVIGRSIVDLSGQSPGSASHAKIVGTVMVVQMIESISEAHVLAEKSGLPAESLHKVINSVFGGPFSLYSNRMMSGSYFREPVIAIGTARTAVEHVTKLTQQSSTELGAFKVASMHMEMVEKYAGAKGDIAGIYGAVRMESGLKFEN